MIRSGNNKSLWRRMAGFFVMVVMIFALSLPVSKKANAICPCAFLPPCDLCCGCSIVIQVTFVEAALRGVYRQFKDGTIGSAFGINFSLFFGFGRADPINYDNPGDDNCAASSLPATGSDCSAPAPASLLETDDDEGTTGPGGDSNSAILPILQNLLIHVWFKGDITDMSRIFPSPLDSVVDKALDVLFKTIESLIGVKLNRFGLLPAMQDMSEEIMQVMFKHTMAIGLFLDAEMQLKTQRLYQELAADVHRRYQPDVGMCILGTSMKSIAEADRNRGFTVVQMSNRSLDRELSNRNSIGATGSNMDRGARLKHFAETFCDPLDNNPAYEIGTGVLPSTGLDFVCEATVSEENYNRDIDYMRTMLMPATLEIDFADNAASIDEQAVLDMNNYLYAHKIINPLTKAVLDNEENIDDYMDLRALVAKRSVAKASFQALTGLKTQGRPADPSIPATGAAQTREYMDLLLRELGLTDDDILEMLGERPSYYAQMKVLAKMIYQRSRFYVGLSTSPENVRRRAAAMEAIKSMLGRDMTESYIRSEAIMSILLEMKVREAQKSVQDVLRDLDIQ